MVTPCGFSNDLRHKNKAKTKAKTEAKANSKAEARHRKLFLFVANLFSSTQNFFHEGDFNINSTLDTRAKPSKPPYKPFDLPIPTNVSPIANKKIVHMLSKSQ